MTLRVMKPTRACWLPLVALNLLNPSSKEHFIRSRSEGLGKSLEAYQKEEGGEEAWIDALPSLKAFGELLGKESGPFINGDVGEYKECFSTVEVDVNNASFLCGLYYFELVAIFQNDR